MSILDRLSRKGRRSIPPGATFTITQLGRDKVSDQFSNDPKGRILTTLETSGSANIDDLAQNSGMHRGQIEKIIPHLINGGYVQLVGGADIDEG